jgi:hypothetical protein
VTEEEQAQSTGSYTPTEPANGDTSELTDVSLENVSAGAPGHPTPIPIPYPLLP